MNQLSESEEKPEGIVIVKEPNLVEQETSLCKSWYLDGMAYCDILSEEIGHHEEMDAVDGLPAGDDASSTRETFAGQETEISAEQRLSVASSVGDVVNAENGAPTTGDLETRASAEQRLSWGSSEADGAHAQERALSGAIKSEASAEEHLPLTENIDAGGYTEERTLPGMVSVELKASAEERLPLTENIDAGGYAEERTLPGMVSVELKASAEQRLSENETLLVSAEQRAPTEVRDGEQQALDEVQIAPSANSSVSMDRVYAEERAHADPALTESHAHELEMHAE